MAGPKRRSFRLVEIELKHMEVESFHSWDKRATAREPEEKGLSGLEAETDVDGLDIAEAGLKRVDHLVLGFRV